MPVLTIITINYNNAEGLQKTMESILNQTSNDFEYIIIDGQSTDGSVEIIRKFEGLKVRNFLWISEKDLGIYHAMNKGVGMAKAEYVQFVNSGDLLAANDVTARMLEKLDALKSESEVNLLYGNMLKPYKGRIIQDKGFFGRQPTMLDFYNGTLNHSPTYIKRSLFDKYGLYDQDLKIVSDWKWFLQVIVFQGAKIAYVDIDVTIFDMTGISNSNFALEKSERKLVLENLLPLSVLSDYEEFKFPMDQIQRINKYWITRKCFNLVERSLFKLEKWLF